MLQSSVDFRTSNISLHSVPIDNIFKKKQIIQILKMEAVSNVCRHYKFGYCCYEKHASTFIRVKFVKWIHATYPHAVYDIQENAGFGKYMENVNSVATVSIHT